jgi:hypothetical protein
MRAVIKISKKIEKVKKGSFLKKSKNSYFDQNWSKIDFFFQKKGFTPGL